MGGWIALWRKIQDNELWREPRVFSKIEAWIDLLMEAQYTEEPQDVVIGMKTLICNYAESLKSTMTWAKRWKWSLSKTKRFFKLLERLGMIKIKSEVVTTRIFIMNYRGHDPKMRTGSGLKSEPETEPQVNQLFNDIDTSTTDKRTGNRTASELQSNNNRITDKKEKNVKNINKEDSLVHFDRFWSIYPRKENKSKAKEIWIRKNLDDKIEIILKAIEQQKKIEGQLKNDDIKYIALPTTWLNGKRWENEPPLKQLYQDSEQLLRSKRLEEDAKRQRDRQLKQEAAVAKEKARKARNGE